MDINKEDVLRARRLLSIFQHITVLNLDITKTRKTVKYLVRRYGKFDAITCFEVFEHIPPRNSILLLENIHSLLSDDGLLFISTPNKRVYDVDAYTPDHINEVDAENFLSLLKNQGFEPVKVMGSHYIPQILQRVLYRFNLIMRSGDVKNELSFQKKLFRYLLCALLDPKRLKLNMIKRVDFEQYLKLRLSYESLVHDYNNSSLVYVVAKKKSDT